MNLKNMNLIDVRTREEFILGSVPNAINIPLSEVVSRIDEIRNLQPLLIFCAAGVRSQKAIDFLVKQGISQVENGGGWIEVKELICKLS